MEGFPASKGSWPWPWPWIRSYCIPSCIAHRPLHTSQISLKSKKLFVDVRTYVNTDYGPTDGRAFETHFLGWLRIVDLKSQQSQKRKDQRRQCFFVTHDLDLWLVINSDSISTPKINGFPGIILEHFCVKLGDPDCIGFWDIVQKNRHTDKRN